MTDDGVGTERLKEIALCGSHTAVASLVIWVSTQAGDDRDFILVLYSELLYKIALLLLVYPSKVYAPASWPPPTIRLNAEADTIFPLN
jgi:hypothetical protein